MKAIIKLITVLAISLCLVGCSNINKNGPSEYSSTTSPNVEYENGKYVARIIYPEESLINKVNIELDDYKIINDSGSKYELHEMTLTNNYFEGYFDADYLGFDYLKVLCYESSFEYIEYPYITYIFNSKNNDLLMVSSSYDYESSSYKITTCYKLFIKEFKRPSDFNLEFWIGETIHTNQIVSHDYFTDEYPGVEILDKSYTISYSGSTKVKPKEYVSYVIDYPEESTAIIEKIIITDPSVSIYGVNLNSNPEDFEEAFEKIGFKFSYGVGSLGKYRITRPSLDGRSIIIWIRETN